MTKPLNLFFNLIQISGVSDAVVNTRQINAKVITAIYDNRIILVFNDHHVLTATTVHAPQTNDLQLVTVVNKVSPPGAVSLLRSRIKILIGDAVGITDGLFLGADSCPAADTAAG